MKKNIIMANLIEGNDYAIMEDGEMEYYYGYDSKETNEMSEGMFHVKLNGKVVYKKTGAKLQEEFKDVNFIEPSDYLDAGVKNYAKFLVAITGI